MHFSGKTNRLELFGNQDRRGVPFTFAMEHASNVLDFQLRGSSTTANGFLLSDYTTIIF